MGAGQSCAGVGAAAAVTRGGETGPAPQMLRVSRQRSEQNLVNKVYYQIITGMIRWKIRPGFHEGNKFVQRNILVLSQKAVHLFGQI